jgi:hypothetical protein
LGAATAAAAAAAAAMRRFLSPDLEAKEDWGE